MRNKQNGSVLFDLITIVLIVVASFVAVWIPLYFAQRYTCGQQATGLGLEYEYSGVVGCRVKVHGRLVPMSMIRITQTGEVIIAPDSDD